MFFAFNCFKSLFGLMFLRRFSLFVSTVVILCSVSVGCVTSQPEHVLD